MTPLLAPSTRFASLAALLVLPLVACGGGNGGTLLPGDAAHDGNGSDGAVTTDAGDDTNAATDAGGDTNDLDSGTADTGSTAETGT
ncbi:MAG: hypothetical protein ACHREM_31655, partial [Polyangiales bacterium]